MGEPVMGAFVEMALFAFMIGLALYIATHIKSNVRELEGALIRLAAHASLVGATIDYVGSLMESGFKIDNPNASNTCGCGSSFGA